MTRELASLHHQGKLQEAPPGINTGGLRRYAGAQCGLVGRLICSVGTATELELPVHGEFLDEIKGHTVQPGDALAVDGFLDSRYQIRAEVAALAIHHIAAQFGLF